MDFKLYPVDQQVCVVKFESFGFQSSQVRSKLINFQLRDREMNSNPTKILFRSAFKYFHTYKSPQIIYLVSNEHAVFLSVNPSKSKLEFQKCTDPA